MLQEPRTIVNACAINEDNVMVTGGDNGALWCACLRVYYCSLCTVVHLAFMPTVLILLALPPTQFVFTASSHAVAQDHSRLHTCWPQPAPCFVPGLRCEVFCYRAYDWKSGNRFQQYTSPVQPGSLESESGIFALTFDKCASSASTTHCSQLIRIHHMQG
jgi:hypothetical protein